MTLRLPSAAVKDLGIKPKAAPAPMAEVKVIDAKPAEAATPEVRVVEVKVGEGLANAVEALREAVQKMQPPAPPKRPTGMDMVPQRNAKGQITSVAITFNWN